MVDVLNPSCLGSAGAQQDHTHPPLCCGPASPATAAATLLLPLLLLLLLLAGDTQSCPIFERRWEAGTIAGADAKSQTASVPVAQSGYAFSAMRMRLPIRWLQLLRFTFSSPLASMRSAWQSRQVSCRRPGPIAKSQLPTKASLSGSEPDKQLAKKTWEA